MSADQQTLRDEYNHLVKDLDTYRDAFEKVRPNLNTRTYSRIKFLEIGNGPVNEDIFERIGTHNYPPLDVLKRKVERAAELKKVLGIS